MLQYILECIAFQLVFLIIYDLFLKRETFFQWNRVYLIGTYVIALLLPWVKIEAMKTTVPEAFQAYPEFLWNTNDSVVVATAVEETTFNISWEYTLLFGGMFIAALFFSYKLHQISTLKRKGEVQYFSDFTQIIISNSTIAFSFFKSIFLGDKVIEKEHQSIVQHELVHIRQRHSYDLIFFELMRIVGWFNPLVYVYQSRVSELHEFIADAQVAKTNKKEQYQLLLSEVFQTQHISFINQFFKSSLIKKRIVMLQKSQSKKIWQLKYFLLVPMVLGMLAYTSAETQTNGIIEQEQIADDVTLILEIEAEIEKEVAKMGSIYKVIANFRKMNNSKGNTHILNKKAYFKEKILFKMTLETMKPFEFGDDVKPTKPHIEIPLPSTSRYDSYVSRKEAFYILDPNLQFSIKAYNQQVSLIDAESSYPNTSYLFEVANVKDLTGKEVKLFNNTLVEIFEREETPYSDLILTDGAYAFQVYTGLPTKDLSFFENSNVEGSVERSDKKIVLNVFDSKHLSKAEKAQREELWSELRNSKTIDTLVVTDGKFSTKTVSNEDTSFSIKVGGQSDPVPFAIVDKVPIFPGCEEEDNKRACFNEKMQNHISKNFNYPKEAQEKGIQGRVSVIFVISKKGKIEGLRMRGPDAILENEVERIINKLPRMKSGKHKGKRVAVPFSIPIVFKLKSENTFEELSENSNQFSSEELGTIKKYNQLVKERQRLLKSSNEKNPIIINIDEQIKAIKQSIANSKQKENRRINVMPKDTKVESYNQLVAERKRLLEISNEKNPIIVNLDAQLKALQESILQETETVPFATIDKVPIFPGCEASENKRKCFNKMIQQHISKNFNYPKEAQEKGIQGRVSVVFTISKDGSIQNIRKRGPDKLLEKEATRIISLLPKMTPGKQKGKAVNVPFSIPITFKLKEEKGVFPFKLDVDKPEESAELVLIDGKKSNLFELSSIPIDNIESMHVLEDGAATRKYGPKGKHGVIEVITKKWQRKK